MKTDEIIKLFDRIKMHYTMFTYNDEKVKEWHKFLKDYSSEDINNKFDEYLSYGYDQPPFCMSLTKDIQKIRKNSEEDKWITCCDICGERITIYNNDMTDYEKHRRKCQKIDFIDTICKRYKGQSITKETYYNMDENTFEQAYRKVMNFYIQNRDKNIENLIIKRIPNE